MEKSFYRQSRKSCGAYNKENICTDMGIPASIELAYNMNGISEVLKAI